MIVKTILLRIILCLTIIALWAWMSADDWEHEMIMEQSEQERIQSIKDYNRRLQSSALSEDDVDTTPIDIPAAEPVFISAKKTVVKTKRRIKRTVKNQAR